jgi:septal ring-binding cell division protein DamX
LNEEEQMAAKSDAIIKLVLVFIISLLSFAVGTFVGKKYSDQQHKMAAYEPTKEEGHGREVASEAPTAKASGMSDEEIAKLAEEFVTDDAEQKDAKTEPSHAENHGEEKPAVQHEAQHETQHETANEAVAHEPKMAQHEPAKNSQHEPVKNSHESAAKAQPESMKMATNTETVKAVKSIPPKAPRVPANLPKDVAQYPVGKFTVQVASFSTEDDAKKRAEELKGRGYSAFYLPATVTGRTWYRVSVGQFATENEAKSYRSDFMQKAKIDSAIIQKITN